MLNFQEAVYPDNYNKLRFLENHDQPRIASLIQEESDLVNYTAMLYFLKGTTLLYAGQEYANTHLPSLFEREPFDRHTGHDLSGLLARLHTIKQGFGSCDDFSAAGDDGKDIAVMERSGSAGHFVGVFSLRSRSGEVALDVPDGSYENRIDGSTVTVKNGSLLCEGRPMIFKV